MAVNCLRVGVCQKLLASVLSVLLLVLSVVAAGGDLRAADRTDDDPMNPGIDLQAFETALTGDGVDGWIHGRLGPLAVFVFRENGNFFRYALFPMVSHVPAIKAELQRLKRHDKIRIKGAFIDNGAPQKHIYVTELVVLERWDGGGGETVPPYEYEAKIPDELLGRREFIGKVHFAVPDGSMIVTEYKDVVIPVVGISGFAQSLYRGDKIKVRYIIQGHPGRPLHLALDPESAEPLTVISHIRDLHGLAACVEGHLVKFPRSPEVQFDVFALQNTDSDSYTLDYTLVNFEDPEIFKAIRAKAAAAWDRHPGTVINGRNKLINPRIGVRACGTLNMQSPSQANPQILLKSLDDLSLSDLSQSSDQ
jgi:hypothetical protein